LHCGKKRKEKESGGVPPGNAGEPARLEIPPSPHFTILEPCDANGWPFVPKGVCLARDGSIQIHQSHKARKWRRRRKSIASSILPPPDTTTPVLLMMTGRKV